MELYGTTHDDALVLVDQLAGHIPADLDVGAPSVVTDHDVLTDRGELVSLDRIEVDGKLLEVGSRTVTLPAGVATVTSWHRGLQVEHRVAPDGDDG